MTSVLFYYSHLTYLLAPPGAISVILGIKTPIRAVRWSARRGPCLEIPSPEVNKLCIGCDISNTIFHVLRAPALGYLLVYRDICRGARVRFGALFYLANLLRRLLSPRTTFTAAVVIGSKVDSLDWVRCVNWL